MRVCPARAAEIELSHDDTDAEGAQERRDPRGRRADGDATPSPDEAPSTGDFSGDDHEERAEDRSPSKRVTEVEAVEEILEGEIDDREVNRLIAHQSWEGPLPPPAALAAYERTLPGAADRVLSLAERSLSLRQSREDTVRVAVQGQADVQRIIATADRDALKRGQWLASAISVLVALLSFAGMLLATPWAAVGFAVPLAQVATALIRTVSDPSRSSDRNSIEAFHDDDNAER